MVRRVTQKGFLESTALSVEGMAWWSRSFQFWPWGFCLSVVFLQLFVQLYHLEANTVAWADSYNITSNDPHLFEHQCSPIALFPVLFCKLQWPEHSHPFHFINTARLEGGRGCCLLTHLPACILHLWSFVIRWKWPPVFNLHGPFKHLLDGDWLPFLQISPMSSRTSFA